MTETIILAGFAVIELIVIHTQRSHIRKQRDNIEKIERVCLAIIDREQVVISHSLILIRNEAVQNEDYELAAKCDRLLKSAESKEKDFSITVK